jgi:hypothetical protein
MLKLWKKTLSLSLLLAVGIVPAVRAAGLVNSLTISGQAPDLTPLNGSSGGANVNRLGGFVSDLYYDRANNVYYGVADRGPGGGVIAYGTRVQKFTLSVDPVTGAISNFQLQATIPFVIPAGTTLNGTTYSVDTPFNGLNPQLLNGSVSGLGLSHDPEGFAVAPNGNFYVSDEYGPSIYEFSPAGRFIRAFGFASNLTPRTSTGTVDYVNGRPTIVNGRQDNRGFEGLALSADGSKAYAILQDPLVNEGSSNDGRNSRNDRIVVFDTASGQPIAQYIYQLESLADINLRVPGNTFNTTSQGRNIGVSSIIPINDLEFLVLERDNRGVGVGDPLGATPVASKRLYRINISAATDVTNVSLAGTNNLPAGVVPVTKNATPFLDIQTALQAGGQVVPEKLEGVVIGPRLNDGTYAVIVGTDNDFSVTQNNSNVQFDVCYNGTATAQATVSSSVAIDAGCPTGQTVIPNFIYGFKTVATDNLVLPPKIASFSPTSGSIGTVVTINGTGFSGTTSVRFANGKAATFTVVSDSQITVTVPPGAVLGKFQVTTPGGRVSAPSSFIVTSPD